MAPPEITNWLQKIHQQIGHPESQRPNHRVQKVAVEKLVCSPRKTSSHGCCLSNEMLNTLHHDLKLNTVIIPGETPWKLSITGIIMKLIKRTTHIYALDQGRDASCQECLLQAVMAHSRLVKHGGYHLLSLTRRVHSSTTSLQTRPNSV